jgi:hypothetical protein
MWIHHFLLCHIDTERRDHLEIPGVDGRIILRWTFRKWYAGMDWIDLAQDRDR